MGNYTTPTEVHVLRVISEPPISLGDRTCKVYRMGRVPYGEALQLQADLADRRKRDEIADSLVLLEHPPVITLGRNARRENLLSSAEQLERAGIELVETNRGGDITFHGPGQLVGYPIVDLGRIHKDVGWYLRTLEEVLIRSLQDIGLGASRKSGMTGVWINRGDAGPAKVAAMGVHLSRWVTSHGFALNIDTDLRYYRHIVPCGISAYPVTSVRESLAGELDREALECSIVRHFGTLMGLSMTAGAGTESNAKWLKTAAAIV
ncbi:MAG: lipoyl(octanoyl) transferase LipB [Acidobacteria bacterium]|nr:lipoyl(octanoyl) transferase LipB [Acidobacteriota bacterium]